MATLFFEQSAILSEQVDRLHERLPVDGGSLPPFRLNKPRDQKA